MKEKIKKIKANKKIIGAVVTIFIMLLLIGGTYAAFRYNFLGANNLINTESIELEFLESSGEIIDIPSAFPMIDSAGIAQEETFDFQVKTKTRKNIDITYELYMEKLTPDDGYTFLQDSEVKVYLTDFNDDEKVAPVKVDELTNYSLYTKTNSHNSDEIEQIDKYKLRIWVDEEVTAKDWDQNTKLQYKFKIGVRAEERILTGTPAITMLMSKVGESGLQEVTHSADSTLQIGATEDITEYRFRGGNDVVTNNYVYFNCEDINNQSSDTCELYRIIGVFPVDDGTGNIENRIKLIKAESYGSYGWNDNVYNNWAKPATLNVEFNTTYYNTMNTQYQALVGDAKFYLGGYNTTQILSDVMYGYERKADENDGGNYYYSDNPTNWTGKIALMYASDYGYAANSECSASITLNDYSNTTCMNNNWLYSGIWEWILPHFPENSHGAMHIYMGDVYQQGITSDDLANSPLNVRPVLYLTSDAEFNDIGDGSQDNPYQLYFGSMVGDESNSNFVYSRSDVELGDTLESISGYTSDYTSLNKSFFLKHIIGSDNTVESNEVCYVLNEELYCLKSNPADYFAHNRDVILLSFGEDNCSVGSVNIECNKSSLYVICSTEFIDVYDSSETCSISDNNRARCYSGGGPS